MKLSRYWVGAASVLVLPLCAATAEAQTEIETKTLFEQQLERLSEQPICWDVRTGGLAPGAKAPGESFDSHGWVAAYITGGSEHVTYEGGEEHTVSAGKAFCSRPTSRTSMRA